MKRSLNHEVHQIYVHWFSHFPTTFCVTLIIFSFPTGLRFLYSIMHGNGLDTTVIFLHATSSYPHGVPDAMDNVDHSAPFNHFHALLPTRGQYHAYDAR